MIKMQIYFQFLFLLDYLWIRYLKWAKKLYYNVNHQYELLNSQVCINRAIYMGNSMGLYELSEIIQFDDLTELISMST